MSQCHAGPNLNADTAAKQIIARYPEHSTVVARVLREYYLNGFEMETSHGLNGLIALDVLGTDALFLNQRHPVLFEKTLGLGDPESVRAVFSCWRPLVDVEGVKSMRVRRWLQTLASLERHPMRVLATHPKALPAIAVAPEDVSTLLDGEPVIKAEPFLYIDYSRDPKGQVTRLLTGLRQAGRLSDDFTEIGGFPGLMLYCAYSPLLDILVPKLGLLSGYAIVQANAADLSELQDSYAVDEIARALLPYSSSNQRSLAVRDALARSSFGIRLLLEFGQDGADCLAATGPYGVDLLYTAYGESRELRRSVVRILVEGKLAAWDALQRYATNPKFREILLEDYAVAAVLQIERADQLAMWRSQYEMRPQNERTKFDSVVNILTGWNNTGEGEIDMIHERGAEYVNEELSVVELAPGYDVVRLVKLLGTGKIPTSAEWAWAAVDATFLVVDVVEIGGAVFLVFATPGVPDEAAVIALMAAQNAARANAKAVCRGGGRVLVQSVRRQLASEIREELVKIVVKEGPYTILEIAIAAARLGADKAGRAISEIDLQAEAHRIARDIPKQTYFWALRSMAGGTLQRESGARLLRSALQSSRLEDVAELMRPSLRFLGLRLVRSGPRSVGGRVIPWTQLVPEGAICRAVEEELVQKSAGSLAISQLNDVLDWQHRMEEAGGDVDLPDAPSRGVSAFGPEGTDSVTMQPRMAADNKAERSARDDE
jgi:hypothetical protein